MQHNPESVWVQQQIDRSIRAYRRLGKSASSTSSVFDPLETVLARFLDSRKALEVALQMAIELNDVSKLIRYRAMMLAVDPRPSTRLALANSLIDGGNPTAASDVANSLLYEKDWSPHVISLKIRALLAANELDALERFLDDVASARELANARCIEAVAIALRNGGQSNRALDWLKKRKWPHRTARSPSIIYERGRLESELGLAEEAESTLSLLANDNHGVRRAGAYMFRARLAHQRGDLTSATQHYSSALTLYQDNQEAAAYLIRRYVASGKTADAKSLIDRIEEQKPDSPTLIPIKALLLMLSGESEAASELYHHALIRDDVSIEYHIHFADLLLENRKNAHAYVILQKAQTIAPQSLTILSRLLRCAAMLAKEPTEVLSICDRILAIDPAHLGALSQRGSTLQRLGRRDEAIEHYLGASRLRPQTPIFWKSAAQLAMSRNRKNDAKRIVRESYKHFSKETSSGLTARADVALAGGLLTTSCAYAQAAVKMEPGSLPARELAARALMDQGDYYKAWPHLLFLRDFPARSVRTTRMFGQAASAFRVLTPAARTVTPVRKQFPQALFSPMVARGRPLDGSQCEPVLFHVTSTLAAGGAERQVAVTATNGKRRSRFGIELIAEDLDSSNGRDFFLPALQKAKIPIHVLRSIRLAALWRDLVTDEHVRDVVSMLGALPQELVQLILPMYSIFISRKPAVVHLWQDMIAVTGGLAAVLAGVPRIVLGTRSTRPVEYQRSRPYFYEAYKALMSAPGVTMVANSANGARDYEDWLGLKRGIVQVVYNGYDFEAMRRNVTRKKVIEIRSRLKIPSDASVFGGVMRCSSEKRPELWLAVAIELVQEDGKCHAVLVGDGPMRSELVAEVARRGLSERIHFVGRQSPIEPWMDMFNVLFLSSVTEGLPNVLIEAQAMGTPVCTMRAGGAPETVQEGQTGLIFDEGSPKQIAKNVRRLLKDPQRLRQFSQQGKKWVDQKFSTKATLSRLEQIYSTPAVF